MKTIWKYPFDVNDVIKLDMPYGASVLSVQTQNGQPCLWALVDPEEGLVSRTFYLLGTGHPADYVEALNYRGTFQLYNGNLVFHLFEG